jgi:calmodulin
METLGIHATEDDIEAMIEEIDLDSNGEIDFEEFVAVMSRKIQADYTAEDVKNSFKVFEGTAPRGMIVAEDLVAALSSYGDEKLSQEEARDLVNQVC